VRSPSKSIARQSALPFGAQKSGFATGAICSCGSEPGSQAAKLPQPSKLTWKSRPSQTSRAWSIGR
jgi:hypothetical protein